MIYFGLFSLKIEVSVVLYIHLFKKNNNKKTPKRQNKTIKDQ